MTAAKKLAAFGVAVIPKTFDENVKAITSCPAKIAMFHRAKYASYMGLMGAGIGAAGAPEDFGVEGAAQGMMMGEGAHLGRRLAAGALPTSQPSVGALLAAALGTAGGAYLGNEAFQRTGAGHRLEEAKEAAALPPMAMQALLGGGLGALAGGGLGAAAAHAKGEPMGRSAMQGALGGAGIGAGMGALGSGASQSTMSTLKDKMFQGGAMGLMGGAGALLGKAITAPFSGDGALGESKSKEMGKLLAQQEMKQQTQLALQPKQEAAFHQVLGDEMVSRAPQELVASSFETMRRIAPNLAADPNAVRSFLKEVTTWGTGPSYATLKNLADAESAVARAGGAL